MGSASTPLAVLRTHKVPDEPLFLLGTFDTGVTVLDQQTRALNLVWALVETGAVATAINADSSKAQRIAIVGGGFAGLTVAAALLCKKVNAKICILEQRDTLLPLQLGSDTRWLHPRIYDWPAEGSESGAALLPVLNWTAARASDVVVQLLTDWKRVFEEHGQGRNVRVFCNARHVEVHKSTAGGSLRIEWVGEARDPVDGMAPLAQTSPDAVSSPSANTTGSVEDFDLVILAIGFGTEVETKQSYWRNETYAQPGLDNKRHTYIVSGQGDGAMMDLLRLRVSQFRQDRILGELFEEEESFVAALERIRQEISAPGKAGGLYDRLEQLRVDDQKAFARILKRMSHRLRRDTEVILSLKPKVRKISELLNSADRRISFQNRVLVYLLYRCGGFFPSSRGTDVMASEVAKDHVIRRHGTDRKALLRSLLASELVKKIQEKNKTTNFRAFLQRHTPVWPGGYFGYPGKTADLERMPEDVRPTWRREYLPGPTALGATTFCASLAGVLAQVHSGDARLRVTLHRVATFGGDEVFQQSCNYQGIELRPEDLKGIARTFDIHTGTLGLAFATRKIVRSVEGVPAATLHAYMKAPKRRLQVSTRDMSKQVTFVLAIPILEPHGAGDRVLAVVYVDSEQPQFFVDDVALRAIVGMTEGALKGLLQVTDSPVARIHNVHLPQGSTSGAPNLKKTLGTDAEGIVEMVKGVSPPKTSRPFRLNFDHLEFAGSRR